MSTYADIEKRLKGIVKDEPEPVEVDRTPVITEAIKKDNYRRLKYSVLATRHADGTTSFVHDIVNRQSDGLISTSATDRKAHEGIPAGADGYGDGAAPKSTGPARDASGKFASKK